MICGRVCFIVEFAPAQLLLQLCMRWNSVVKIWCWARLDLVLCELDLELSGVGFGVM